MEKDQNTNSESQNREAEEIKTEEIKQEELIDSSQPVDSESPEKTKEVPPEEKILELEDRLARAFAEMENQRRRFEKEREDAFSYGGFAFAKETLNLIDNLERSKQILESDEALKNSDALKKNFRTF